MKESKPEVKRVLVVDRQEYWRGISAGALKIGRASCRERV